MLHRLFVLLVLVAASPVNGFTLGDVKLRSYLMEPLLVEIAIVEAQGDELKDVKIRMASQADFDRFGVDRESMHDNVTFNIVQKNGAWVVEVRSARPIREPYFAFPVEAVWRDGQYVREYTVFLDPRPVQRAAVAKSRTPPPQPGRAEQPEPAPVAQPTPPAREFWPVKRGDTLWGIAESLKPPSATTPQMMMALLRANPEAFPDNNVNNLKAGSNLRIPDSGEIQTQTARQARNAFDEQTRQWREAVSPPAEQPAAEAAPPPPPAETEAVVMSEESPPEAVPELPAEAEQPAKAEQPEEAAEAVAAEEVRQDSQLRIIEDPPKPTEEPERAQEIAELERQLLLALEQSEADRLELQTLDERVEQIQVEMMRMRRLIILKNEQIAALQAVRDNEPLPPRIDIDKVAPRPDEVAAAPEVDNDKRPIAVQVDKPQAVAVEPMAEFDWGIWLAIGAGLLGLLLLLTLYLRREREVYVMANHPGMTPPGDRPYADRKSHFGAPAKDAVAVTPTGKLSGYDSEERGRARQRPEGWQRDELGTEVSRPTEAMAADDIDGSSHMTDEELETLVRDLNVDFDSIDTGSSLLSESITATGSEEYAPLTQPSEPGRNAAPGGDDANAPPPAEGETDVAALRLELAQAYLEIGEIDGARDILTQVVEEAMEGPEQEEARRLLESLG